VQQVTSIPGHISCEKTDHGRYGELALVHLLGEPIDLSPCVAENDGLGDRDGLIKVTERVKLPLLLLDSNVELLDTFERQLITFDEDTDGVAHEFFCHLKYVCGHGS